MCSNSETCLFTSDTLGNLWEGCGQTSISYDWVTECWDYPQTGIPPVSQIYCPEAAPSCGFLAFQFDDFNTYYNFGCSTVSYSLYVDLLSTTDFGSSQTLILAGGGTNSLTETAAATEIATETDTPTSVPAAIATGFGEGTATTNPTQSQPGTSSSSSTIIPIIGSHKTEKKTPIGAIVGGVIGGLALLAVLVLLVWYVLRKRRHDAAASQSHQAQLQTQAGTTSGAAFIQSNRISEIAGTMKPMPEHAGAFAPQQQAYANRNENEKLMGAQVNGYPSPITQSPPPVYAQPNGQAQQQQELTMPPHPPSNNTELDNQNLQPGNSRISVPPVSPAGTYNSSMAEMGGSTMGTTYQPSALPPAAQAYQSPPNIQEMNGETYQQIHSPPIAQHQMYQNTPNLQEMHQPASSPISQVVYQPPTTLQEMNGSGVYQQQPVTRQQGYQSPVNIQEMSGNAATIRPVGQGVQYDMSGAPLSESFGHHELP